MLPCPPHSRPGKWQSASPTAAGGWICACRRPSAGGHVPGSINVWREGLSAYFPLVAGVDDPLVLVLPEGEPVGTVARELLRIGFDRVAGVLAGGFEAWQNAGREIHRLETLSTPEVEAALRGEAPALDSEPLTRHSEPPTPHGEAPARLLDVRPPGEWAEGMVPGAEHLFVGES